MIYGLMQPDLQYEAEFRKFQTLRTKQARQSGIAMVFQHFSLFDALNVAKTLL